MAAAPPLFVYGTLMRGEYHHGTLGAARYLGPAQTAAEFSLHLVDYYPAMSRPGLGAVYGELFEVDDAALGALDALEDVPALYLREAIPLADGRVAQAYVLPAARVPAGARPIPSGNFRVLPPASRAPRL